MLQHYKSKIPPLWPCDSQHQNLVTQVGAASEGLGFPVPLGRGLHTPSRTTAPFGTALVQALTESFTHLAGESIPPGRTVNAVPPLDLTELTYLD